MIQSLILLRKMDQLHIWDSYLHLLEEGLQQPQSPQILLLWELQLKIQVKLRK